MANNIRVADLELQISSNTTSAVDGISRLIEKLGQLKQVSSDGLGLNKLAKQFTNFNASVQALDLSKLKDLKDILSSIGSIGAIGSIQASISTPKVDNSIASGETATNIEKTSNATEKLTEDLEDMQKASSQIKSIDLPIQNLESTKYATQELENLAAKAKELSDTNLAQQVDRWNYALQSTDKTISLLQKKIATIKGKIVSETDEVKLNNLNLQLQAINDRIANLQNKQINIKTNIANKLKETNKESQKTNKELKNTEKQAYKSATAIGKFVKSIGRIALYRAIRSLIKGIVSAFKTGTQNLYQFDKEFNGTFSQAMDKISSSAQNIKNSLAVAFAPLVESLAPAIERVSDLFLQFGNTVSKVAAKVNGKSTYTKATKSVKEYQDSLESAKKSTMGFDELNIIDKGDDVASMFEEVDLEDNLSESEDSLANLFTLIKEIADIIKTDILPFIKDVLGSVLKELVPVLQFVGKLIKYIVSVVGQILNSDEASGIITTLSNVIQSVVRVLDSAMPTIKTIIEIIAKVLQKIIGFLNRIANNGINKIENAASTILTLIDGILGIVDIILDLLDPILDIITEIIEIVTTLVDSILVAIKPILEGIFDVLNPIVRILVDLVASAIKPIAPILQLICGLISDVLAPILEKVGVFVKPLLEFIGTALQGILGWVSGIAEWFNNGITDAIQGVVLVWKAFFSLFSGDTEKIKEAWSKVGDHIHGVWSRLWDGKKSIFCKILNGIITGFEKFVNALIDAVNWVGDKLNKVREVIGLPSLKSIEHVAFNKISYATGGYDIPRGQLFVANEMGAEMVGSMDGKTAVANNQQIVEGIKQGVYDAILSASSIGGTDKQINLALYLDGRQIKAEMDRLSQSKGASISTGGLVYYG